MCHGVEFVVNYIIFVSNACVCIFECAGVSSRLVEAVVVFYEHIDCNNHQIYLISGGSDPAV